MKPFNPVFMSRPSVAGLATLVALATTPSFADDAAKTTAPPAVSAAAPIGGALPGGAIISAKFAQLTPAAGGNPVVVALASDGSFHFDNLKPGTYRFTVMSTSRQTQNASFGEKVQSGLAQTGGALASGAAVTQHGGAASATQGARLPDSTPARISTNFTVGKQSGRLMVDGPGVDVQVGADGSLSGKLSAASN
jgi:hypothetical protein